jgi:rubrerythrin
LTVEELLTLARQVELRVGRLYEHMARDFDSDPALVSLLQTLANQEVDHAGIIESAMESLEFPRQRITFDTSLFTSFLDSIDDIEDEVCSEGISATAAREIVAHMESSIAERFYGQIPKETPGIDPALVERMIQTSRAHLRLVREFTHEDGATPEGYEG